MTEEEAKTKICPILPIVKTVGIERNVFEKGDAFSYPLEAPRNCIGSACMMWRVNIHAGQVLMETETGREFVDKVGGGYCGLAGKS